MKKRIMVVDDEEHILVLVKALLETSDYEVILAHDGKECLELLKKQKPDLVLLDIMMPGMSGVEVCEAIRKDSKLKPLKIIYLTVVGVSEIEREKLKKSNVLDYIQKPFNNDDFIARVKEALK